MTIVDNNMAAQVTNHSLELSARGNKKEDIRVVIKITSSIAEREISFIFYLSCVKRANKCVVLLDQNAFCKDKIKIFLPVRAQNVIVRSKSVGK